MTLSRPPEPSRCAKCGWYDATRWLACPICKTPVPHTGDRVVMVGVIGISIGISVYSIVMELMR